MAIRIRARHGESVNQMLRRFKKLCEKEGLTKDVKRKQYFEKPSERKRRAQRKSVARNTRIPGTFSNSRSSSGPGGGRSTSGPGGPSGSGGFGGSRSR